MRLKSQEDLAGGGGEHRGLLQSDLSGSKPRPYAMKTETNRCASAGCCASAGGAIMLFAATYLGISISTTHTVTGAVIGVGAARKVPAVRWNIAANIVIAGSLHSEKTVNPAGNAKPEELDADRAINEHALDNAINDLSI